jgi:hypothetical protein
MKKIFLFSLAVLFFAGCAPILKSSQDFADHTHLLFDKYKKTYTVDGYKFTVKEFPPTGHSEEINLEAFLHEGMDDVIYLAVNCGMESWSFFDGATDFNGNELKVDIVSRNLISGDLVIERVAVNLSREYLESMKESGLNIRLEGKRGNQTVKVPSAYIIGFLEKYDQYSQQVKGMRTIPSPLSIKPSPTIIQKDVTNEKLK